MNAKNKELSESIELALKLKIRLLKWLLAFQIISFVGFISFAAVFIWLSFQFPVILNKTKVVVQCDEIKTEEKMFAFTIKNLKVSDDRASVVTNRFELAGSGTMGKV